MPYENGMKDLSIRPHPSRVVSPMLYDCDVIVVGGGAGGATFASACARAGRSVLLLERGRKYVVEGPAHNEQAMLIEERPYDDREVEGNGTPRRRDRGG